MSKTALGVSALLAVVVLVTAGATPAFAHVQRKVGHYEFLVGFGDEPPYAGFSNSVQLELSDARTGKPVNDLGSTLKVQVKYGSKSKTLPVEPNFEIGEDGTPGDYRAWFFPTQPGRYTFHFLGSIHGQHIDETFTSGPKTFDDVQDAGPLEFPVRYPSTGELSQRVVATTDITRSATHAANSSADSAKTIGIVAIVLAVLALVTSGATVIRRRSS
jgi:hypothetical protein